MGFIPSAWDGWCAESGSRGLHAFRSDGNFAPQRHSFGGRQCGGAGQKRHRGQADGALADACERHGHHLPFENARLAANHRRADHRRRGHGPPCHGRAGLDSPAARRSSTWDQPHHRSRRSCALCCQVSRSAWSGSGEGLRAGWRRSSRCRGNCRRHHSRSWRRGTAHHRHAHEQHDQSSAAQACAAGPGSGRQARCRRN